MNSELFKAILAMDSYNRGYGAGINFGIGPDNIDSDNIGVAIGNATISGKKGDAEAVAAGFYAITYDYNGQKIISYRGTEGLVDLLTGWPIAVGITNTAYNQAKLALDFYKAQYPTGVDLYSVQNVSFTGHSLGGALAGFMAGIYGQFATIFDNQPFELATDILHGTAALFNVGLPAVDFSKIDAYATAGELLYVLRDFGIGQSTPVTAIPTYSGFSRTPVDLHSQSLLVNLLYAKTEEAAGQLSADWHSVAVQLIDSLFSNDVAKAAGAQSILGAKNVEKDFAEILRSAIAYSAIDDGTRVFGDTAIRAMFNDAGELGKVMGFANLSSALNQSAVSKHSLGLKTTAEAISNILVQFAGQLAINRVLANAGDPLLKGVLTLAEDENTLAIDLDPLLWTGASSIVGKQEILAALPSVTIVYGYDSVGNPTQTITTNKDLVTGMSWLWNDPAGDKIDSITFGTHNSYYNATIADRYAPSSNVALFIAGSGGNIITGSSGNDFIYGGGSIDSLRGAAGDDLLSGGAGNDLLYGGLGRDFLVGGSDNDTLDGGAGNDVMDGGDDYDTVKYEDSVNVKITETTLASLAPISSVTETDFILNVERIDTTSGKDTLDITLLANTSVKEIHTGAGADTVSVSGASAPYLKIYLEGGDDILKSAPRGAIVYGGAGNDTFALGQDYLVADAEAGDKFTYFGKDLYGGTRWRGQESADAKGLYGIKYERSTSDELIIIDQNVNANDNNIFQFEIVA